MKAKLFVRRLLLWLSLTLVGLLLLLSLAVYWVLFKDQEQIRSLCVSELNKSLVRPVSIREMKFTFWSSFPAVALDLRGVKALGAGHDSLPLLDSEHLSLRFNLRDIFARRYHVKSIDIQGAHIYVKRYADGQGNYLIWRNDKKTEELSDFSFDLQKITIRETHIHYCDEESEQNYRLFAQRLRATGKFSKDLQNISLTGHLFVESFQSGAYDLLSKKNVHLDTRLDILTHEKRIRLLSGELGIEGLRFRISGNIDYGDRQEFMALNIEGQDLRLHELIEQLPEAYSQAFENVVSKGKLDFQAEIKGRYFGHRVPTFRAVWNFREGTLYQKGTPYRLDSLSFSGEFSTGENSALERHRLLIRQCRAQLPNGRLAANLSIENFAHPRIRLNSNFALHWKELMPWIKIEQIEQLEGFSRGHLEVDGEIETKADGKRHFLLSRLQGQMQSKALFIQLQDSLLHSPLRLDSSDIRFDEKTLHISFAKGSYENYRFTTRLQAHNLFPFLNGSERLSLRGQLALEELTLSSASSDSSQNLPPFPLLPENVELSLSTRIDKVVYQDFEARKLSALLFYRDRKLTIDSLKMNCLDGSVVGQVDAAFPNSIAIPIYLDGEVKNINSQKLFQSFGNFGQKEITDQHLNGTLNAKIRLYVLYVWGKGFDSESLNLSIETQIRNGELNNYPTLQKLSRFVDEETLNHVKFSTLENTLIIRENKILIPEMQIRSNALNLTISGTHSFDNEIDYSIRLSLSELLSRKRRERRKNKEDDEQAPTDSPSRTQLYVYVTGTTDNPKFRYDFKRVSRNLDKASPQQLLRQEKESVKNMLQEDFQFLQKNEETRRQQALWKEQEKGKFVIEWEEDTKNEKKDKPQAPKAKKDTARVKVVFEDE